MDRRFNLIGPGRAGGSIAKALVERGWTIGRTYFREDDPADAATGVDLCVIATPDAVIEHTASLIEPGSAVVLHLSGVTPVSALGSHRGAALHPLVSLPDPDRGAGRLASAWFAVGGDTIAAQLADELSGRWFRIADEDRPLYHAAAVVASNHVIAVLGQAERIGKEIGLPLEALVALARATVTSAEELGPAAALTGPVSRGDEATIRRHLDALEEHLPDEIPTYSALVSECRRLAAEHSAD